MVLLRLSHFVFQLILVFLAIGNIQALNLKGFETSITTGDNGSGTTKTRIDVPMWDGSSFNRKMSMKLDQVLYSDETAKTSSGATNCEKRNLKVMKHKLKNKSKLLKSGKNHAHPPLNVKLRNFMVLNADYHVPRPHPPKNN